MKTILITPITDLFRWQIDLLLYAARKVGHNDVVIGTIPLNHPTDEPKALEGWPSHPFIEIKSFFQLNPSLAELPYALPLNIQYGIAQLIKDFDDNEPIELIETDMVHLRKPVEVITDGILVDDVYESWHLHSLSSQKHLIKYLTDVDEVFYNGGFFPIVCKVGTLRRILPHWINYHVKILHMDVSNDVKWWAGMYGLQAACQKLRIPMYKDNCCYVPPVNGIDGKRIVHYSVDNIYNKKLTPWVLKEAPNNAFYRLIARWLRDGAKF